MHKPSEPHVRWDFEWRDSRSRFHIWDFQVDKEFRNRGHGGRLLLKVIEYVCIETEADSFSIQMGGGANSARWIWDISRSCLEYMLRVEDVQGYEGDDWKSVEAERIDGDEDREGDAQSSVYAVIDELNALRELKEWS